jgi:hypothetical protein
LRNRDYWYIFTVFQDTDCPEKKQSCEVTRKSLIFFQILVTFTLCSHPNFFFPRSERMKILRASLLALLLASLSYGQHTASITVGVYPFKALNTSQIVADRFADLFAATLAVDGKMIVRDRAAIIDELAGEPMPSVVDAAAAADIGKRLGLEAIVFGTVTQVDTGYTVRVSLVNVSQVRVIYEQTMNYVEGNVTLYSHYKGILADLLAKVNEEKKPQVTPSLAEKTEVPKKETEPVQQKEEIRKDESSSSTIYWIIGGVVAGGGVLAAVLIGGGGSGGSDGPTKLPNPPRLP